MPEPHVLSFSVEAHRFGGPFFVFCAGDVTQNVNFTKNAAEKGIDTRKQTLKYNKRRLVMIQFSLLAVMMVLTFQPNSRFLPV
jgi:hypothetical protein